MNTSLIDSLKEFMENEARSCSMDFGCVTPEYVYRMWGGKVPLNDIEAAMRLMVHGYEESEDIEPVTAVRGKSVM